MTKDKTAKEQDKDAHKDRRGPLSVIAEYLIILLLGIFTLKMFASWITENRIALVIAGGIILMVAVIAKIILHKNDRF